MTKTELINRRTRLRNQLSQKQSQLNVLKNKLQRLKEAKAQFIGVINDSEHFKKKLGSLDIDPSFWRGKTEQVYKNNHHRVMEKSLNNYIVHLNRVEADLDSEITRLTSQLSQCQSDIASLNSSISSINHSINALKES